MSPSEQHDEIDRLLRQTGTEWRAAQPPAPEPDLSAGRGGRRRSWVPVLAAAAVAIIVVGAIVWPGRDSGTPVATNPPRPTGPQSELVVRDGDMVEVSGPVVAAPGKPVYFCPPVPMAMPGTVHPRPTPICGGPRVALTNVDLDRLTGEGNTQGTRYGFATLRGIWRSGSIEVREYAPPRVTAVRAERHPLPCPAPVGGWVPIRWADGQLAKGVQNSYIRSHPTRFGPVYLSYPSGPFDTNRTSTRRVPEVAVVPVITGDVDRARQELRPWYGVNLCVVRGTVSIAEASRIDAELRTLRENPANGIILVGSGAGDRPVTVEMLVLDERIYGELARIGIDKMTLELQVRRVS